MRRQLSNLCLGVLILLTILDNCHIDCFKRLLGRKLTSNEISSKNFDDIRDIVSASLTANEPRATVNDNKRDTSIDRSGDKSSIEIGSEENNNAASESKQDSPIYEDDIEEDDGGKQRHVRQLDDAEYNKRSDKLVVEGAEKSELANYDDQSNSKDVAKREARNEEDYDEEDFEVNPEGVDTSGDRVRGNEVARSTIGETNPEGDLKKIDNSRDTSEGLAEDSDLDYEKQIEDQIQRKIDAIKEDIKREIERKQQVREIEAKNAKYDELMFPREENNEVAEDTPADSSRGSISDDSEASNESEFNVKSKRRSDLDEQVAKSEDSKVSAPLPVKKRSYARRSFLVEQKDTRKRINRRSILIPERSHAEVNDELPADLTLDPNLRIARSDEGPRESENLRSARSVPRLRDEYPAGRYRRDMSEELEDKVNEESSNFLFAPREKSNPRARRRRNRARDRTSRSIDRGKARKHRHSRRHRATRESSIDDSEREEERDKRAMSLDEDAALEYKESFGGFPSESGGALGRFKRIKRSAKIS